MTRAIETFLKEDSEFFTCARLKQVTEEQLRLKVFDTTPAFCLVDERARLLRELGQVMDESFEGSFVKFVEASGYDCGKLVEMIVQYLPGFRDEAIYCGRQIFFYKRAQILTADLIGAYSDIGLGDKWINKDSLTMFADYRVP